MAKFNDSNIPEEKFAEVIIGNNGVKIVQKEESRKISDHVYESGKTHTIYLSAEDIVQIFVKFIADSKWAAFVGNDDIETVYLNTEVEDIDERDEDKIIDASY